MEAVVDAGLASKFATEKDTPYTRWVAAEGLDIISGHYVRDLRPWSSSRGRPAAAGRLHQSRRNPDLERLLRLRDPGRRRARPQRQLFEEMILVLDG